MGFRFQKRISILPGVRINLSKSGVSTSLGPRGADVNIGKDGVTANAGIPGTGLSYRQKVGRGGTHGLLAVLLVVGGLIVWGVQHLGKIEKSVAPLRPTRDSSTVLSTGSRTDSSTDSSTGSSTRPAVLSTQAAQTAPSSVNNAGNMQRYVHRTNAILRDEPKASGHILKREIKGASLVLVSESDGGWSKVTDGNITGYMRSSLLGAEPPR